jgi:hypothetical protein
VPDEDEQTGWEGRVQHGRFEAMPTPFRWDGSARFAHLLNGYDIEDSFDALAKLANKRLLHAERHGVWKGSARELWLCLFFEHRLWRHGGAEFMPPEAEASLDALCETLRRRLVELDAGGRAEMVALLARTRSPVRARTPDDDR